MNDNDSLKGRLTKGERTWQDERPRFSQLPHGFRIKGRLRPVAIQSDHRLPGRRRSALGTLLIARLPLPPLSSAQGTA
jgi:hypothetical protein